MLKSRLLAWISLIADYQTEVESTLTAMKAGHKVISNLMNKVHEAGLKEKVTVNLFQKNEDKENDAITYLKSGNDVKAELAGSTSCVIGCTDFTWATMPREGLDYLVIDEAGQFSLTGLLAIAHCTKNIILLGDGAQLTQPLKGSHPDGCEVSALDYIVGDAKIHCR